MVPSEVAGLHDIVGLPDRSAAGDGKVGLPVIKEGVRSMIPVLEEQQVADVAKVPVNKGAAPSPLVETILKAEAELAGSVSWKRKKSASEHDLMGIPSFILKASEFGPNVLEELAAMLGGAGEALRVLCSAMHKVGFSAEPGYKVSRLPLGW